MPNNFYKYQYTKKIIKRIYHFKKLSPPKYVIREDLGLIYLPISKAGNSSIKKTMIPKKENIFDDNSVHAFREGIIRSYTIKKQWEDFYKFSFVRNPFERLVSCYISKYHNDKKYNLNNLWFDTYLYGVMKKDKGFTNFANWVCKIPNNIADEHFISQSYQLFENNKLIVDFVGKLENINTDFIFFEKKFKLEKPPHYNKSTEYNWMDFYTPNLIEKVYKRYKNDIEKFNYENEYESLKNYIN